MLILAGVDGSVRSAGVLAAASSMARAHGGKIALVRAVALPPDVPQDFFRATDLPLVNVLERAARDYLDQCVASIPPELLAPDPVYVTIGVAWDGLCDEAKRRKANLLVIGSHGYGALDRLLGTTAAKVVNHAHCSVLVVREPIDEPAGATR
jgi:nucleotide-binding universal stress UspA family protein